MSTGTAVAITERRSVIREMAHKYGMEPDTFEATVRATCMPQGHNVQPMTREEFAAGIMVADKYTLNPILREIYFYPRKGGGIVPVVSIDGWLSLINRRKELDGVEFDELHDDKGKLISITCRIYRTDRKHPTIVTEHLSECIRDTAPWKMPHRMLRHKALIQCARYAFGFAGIHDEDEAERIVDAVATEVSGPAAPPPAAAVSGPSAPPSPAPAAPTPAAQQAEEAELVEEAPSPELERAAAPAEQQQEQQHPQFAQEEPFDVEAWLKEAQGLYHGAKTISDVDDVHAIFEDTANDLPAIEAQRYEDMHAAAIERIKAAEQQQTETAQDAVNIGEAPAARYFIHPESGSYWQTIDGSDGSKDGTTLDPLVEEVSLEQFQAFQAAMQAKGEAKDDDVELESDDDEQDVAEQPTVADLYVTKIRAMIADRDTPFPVIGRYWNDTKAERAEMLNAGLMSKETRNELLDELDQRKKAAGAAPQDGGPSAPPPPSSGPGATPAPANDEDPITKLDREFRAALEACTDKVQVAALAAETLVARNKFSQTPQHKAWSDLVAAKRKSFAGVTV